MSLTDFEMKILNHLNGGDEPDLMWGAAMSAAVEFLSGDGYLTRGPNYKLTDRGREALRSGKGDSQDG